MATNNLQRDQLHKTIWEIANTLRGAIDGWEFKSYVLGTIFYRFVSENMQQYIAHLQEQAGVPNFDYSKLDDRTAEAIREQMVTEKGYFILPSQLFCNVCANCEHDDNLNITLQKVFRSIEASAQGTESEEDVKGLFSDFAVDNTQLGSSVVARNKLLAKVLLAVRSMDLKSSSFEDNNIDTFGDAYEFLMQMYASEAGKSGGEFFTPQEVSELLAMIASFNNNIKSVYDPACGSGSLLLKIAKIIGKKDSGLRYYGQEINPTTYNLCRINMFLHNINFDNFDIKLGDTLHYPQHLTFKGKFDAIVSNPPYSLKWDGKDNPILINDDRYKPAGILAPKSAADLAFTMHMLYHLSETGTCAIVEFPGVLYRGGAEQKIREYLVKNNFVDAVINLPANLFFGVGIQTCIIVLKKNKKDSDILFINAENEFQKVGNKNKLMPEHQNKIFEAYTKREDQPYFCKLAKRVEVETKAFNLSVSSYVEQEDKREVINIEEVNANLEDIVKNGQALRQAVINTDESGAISIKELISKYCPDGVEGVLIGSLIDLYTGVQLNKSEMQEKGSFPVINGGINPSGYIEQFNEDANTITISQGGASAGYVNYITSKFWAGAHCFVIKPDEQKVNKRYLYNFLKNEEYGLQNTQQGAGIPSVNRETINSLTIPLPPLPVQEEIVRILDSMTALQDNLEAELAERRKQYEYYRNKLLSFE